MQEAHLVLLPPWVVFVLILEFRNQGDGGRHVRVMAVSAVLVAGIDQRGICLWLEKWNFIAIYVQNRKFPAFCCLHDGQYRITTAMQCA